ncbi:amidohydrolase [Halobacteriales archaeon SW_7_68_16]|nr:MAG: amidohydrolase [Halobacteriales archaeon SW_7_68_16]
MLELEHGFRVIDANARLPARPDAAERLERELRHAGIVRAVVAPPSRPDAVDGTAGEATYLADNNGVARLSVERPFVPFARLSGPRDPRGTPTARLRNLGATPGPGDTSPVDVRQYAVDDRFAGFVLAPTVDGLPDEETLATLAETGAPVVVRAGDGFPPDAVAGTTLDRGITTVLAGFGGYPLQRPLMERAIDLLSEYADCYLDTSFVRFRGPMERALREHPDRVLFGSGALDTHPNVAVMEVLTLDVTEDAMRRAFANNIERALGV